MKKFLAASGIAASILASACGSYGSSPTTPSGSASAPEGAMVIKVVGINGSLSFSPG